MRSWSQSNAAALASGRPLYRQSTAINMLEPQQPPPPPTSLPPADGPIRSPVPSSHLTDDNDPVSEGHGLPKKFLAALRELFEVLDDRKTGLLRITDIQSRWIDDESAFFPRGFMDCLRKVAPINGYVDFDRFVAAIKFCLLRNQSMPASTVSNSSTSGNGSVSSNNSSLNRPLSPYNQLHRVKSRSASVPVPDLMPPVNQRAKPPRNYNSYYNQENYSHPPPAMVSTLPHHLAQTPQRGIHSMPKLPQRNGEQIIKRFNSDYTERPKLPPKPNKKSSNIIDILKNWRDSVIDRHFNDRSGSGSSKEGDNMPPTLESLDSALSGYHTDSGLAAPPPHFPSQSGMNSKRNRNAPRRHTVGASGIDFNSIRRMQQLEQEKELLLRGLKIVDRAKEYYLRQIHEIQDKIRYVGHSVIPPDGQSIEANQERLNFKAQRIMSTNQQLLALMDSETYPIQLNLAFQPLLDPHNLNDGFRRLRDQNRLLSGEVAKKNDLISKLEQEKSTLIRELYGNPMSGPYDTQAI